MSIGFVLYHLIGVLIAVGVGVVYSDRIKKKLRKIIPDDPFA